MKKKSKDIFFICKIYFYYVLSKYFCCFQIKKYTLCFKTENDCIFKMLNVKIVGLIKKIYKEISNIKNYRYFQIKIKSKIIENKKYIIYICKTSNAKK